MKLFRAKLNIDVLGAGPAGLLAAHAAQDLGHKVRVFSAPDAEGRPRKSELHGCQYLHQRIPGLALPPQGTPVRYLLNGSVTDYRRKVYGDQYRGSVSPDEYGPEADHLAWDLRVAYDRLWATWKHRIQPLEVTPRMAEAVNWRRKGSTILCTVPASALCLDMEEHRFVSQSVWAMGSLASPSANKVKWMRDAQLPHRAPDNTVECDGTRERGWYRAATVFGQSTLEWPAGKKPPVAGVVAVSKPLSTDCTCHVGDHWWRLGRYGKWTKGVLVHTAYEETRALLA